MIQFHSHKDSTFRSLTRVDSDEDLQEDIHQQEDVLDQESLTKKGRIKGRKIVRSRECEC